MTKLYLSGCHHHYKFLTDFTDVCFLVSYYYLRNTKAMWGLVEYCNDNSVPVMLDSGAYSAMTKGETIDNQAYIEFCLEHMGKFDTIVSLDVVGDYKATAKNHEEMKRAGVNGITTFHKGSPFSELKRLMKEEGYIGIGGVAGKGNRTETQNWVKYIFSLKNGCEFHGFGVTTPSLLHYNWYSVDGTTPMTAAIIYGRIMINLGDGNIKWIHIRDEQARMEVWPVIEDSLKGAWDLEKNEPLENYAKIALRHNVRTLMDVLNNRKDYQPIVQEFLL